MTTRDQDEMVGRDRIAVCDLGARRNRCSRNARLRLPRREHPDAATLAAAGHRAAEHPAAQWVPAVPARRPVPVAPRAGGPGARVVRWRGVRVQMSEPLSDPVSGRQRRAGTWGSCGGCKLKREGCAAASRPSKLGCPRGDDLMHSRHRPFEQPARSPEMPAATMSSQRGIAYLEDMTRCEHIELGDPRPCRRR